MQLATCCCRVIHPDQVGMPESPSEAKTSPDLAVKPGVVGDDEMTLVEDEEDEEEVSVFVPLENSDVTAHTVLKETPKHLIMVFGGWYPPRGIKSNPLGGTFDERVVALRVVSH